LTEPRSGVAVLVATIGPVGRFPIAPGTAGSLVGVACIAVLQRLLRDSRACSIGVIVVEVILYVVGVWAASRAEKHFAITDPGAVVIDEVAGQILTFVLCPLPGWLWLVAGLGLFRLFDVLKPFPARRAERLPGGWGIMTDDVIAGAYSAVALFFLGFAIS